jgi:hypothetical protein
VAVAEIPHTVGQIATLGRGSAGVIRFVVDYLAVSPDNDQK